MFASPKHRAVYPSAVDTPTRFNPPAPSPLSQVVWRCFGRSNGVLLFPGSCWQGRGCASSRRPHSPGTRLAGRPSEATSGARVSPGREGQGRGGAERLGYPSSAAPILSAGLGRAAPADPRGSRRRFPPALSAPRQLRAPAASSALPPAPAAAEQQRPPVPESPPFLRPGTRILPRSSPLPPGASPEGCWQRRSARPLEEKTCF